MNISANILFDNRYCLLEMKGRGSYGEVWRARDQRLDIDVAVKIYVALDSRGYEEFKSEYMATFGLNHPNLLRAYYFDIYEDRPYLVMPYCPNSSVDFLGNVDETTMWHFIYDVASGLEYLHRMGIVHHDIKPDNILMDEYRNFLITDFGISIKLRSTLRVNTKRESHSKVAGGSIPYMAPEMFDVDPEAVNASDIWALGVTMYELITGDLPFFGQGGALERMGAAVPDIHSNHSDDLKRVVQWCMALNPWDRPMAKQLVKVSQAALNGERIDFTGHHAERSSDTRIDKREEESARRAEEAERRAETARKKAEEEAKIKAEEEARKKAEEEARRKAEKEAQRKAEEEARRKAEEEARRKAEKEAQRKAEEEARRKAKEEARRKAEEEARMKAEEEARRKAEKEAQRKAEEEARRKAEEEARRRAEEEARKKAEEEARRKVEREAQRKAEKETRKEKEEKKTQLKGNNSKDIKKKKGVTVAAIIGAMILIGFVAYDFLNKKDRVENLVIHETVGTVSKQEREVTKMDVNMAQQLLMDKSSAQQGLQMLAALADSNNYEALILLSRLYFDPLQCNSKGVDFYRDEWKTMRENCGLESDNELSHQYLMEAYLLMGDDNDDYAMFYELGCDFLYKRGAEKDWKKARWCFEKVKTLVINNPDATRYLVAIKEKLVATSSYNPQKP